MENKKRKYVQPTIDFFSEYDTETELMYGGGAISGGTADGLFSVGSGQTTIASSVDDDDSERAKGAWSDWSDFEYYIDLGGY